jgi:hypothetical protein
MLLPSDVAFQMLFEQFGLNTDLKNCILGFLKFPKEQVFFYLRGGLMAFLFLKQI